METFGATDPHFQSVALFDTRQYPLPLDLHADNKQKKNDVSRR